MEMTVGLILIIIGVILLIAEVIIPGFFIGVVATAMLVLGVVAVIVGDDIFGTIWVAVILIGGIGVGMVISILFYKKIGKITKPITTVGDALVGRTGIMTVETDPIHPTKGKVRIESEIWSAEADSVIKMGTKVEVVESIGAHVKVKVFREKKKKR